MVYLKKKMVPRSLLVCVNGCCESCHFDESVKNVTTTIDKELFAGRAAFCDWLLW